MSKIVISATGNSLDAQVDPRFGRAAWLLIVETKTGKLVEAIENSAGVGASQGAGIAASALVADKGVQAVLTGRVGPKAVPVLEKANIQIINDVSGSVKDVVAEFVDPNQQVSQAGVGSGAESAPAGCARGAGKGQGRGKGKGKGQGRGQCRR